ncbi:MAG: hypothetical protein ACFE9N_07155 [Promethearchaeota archaeon]
MKKKDMQKENKIVQEKKTEISEIDRRFEITSQIDELNILAQNSYLSGDYHKAISYAEKIIKLAVKANVQSYVKEQEKFINIIADKLQKEYMVSEIKNVATGVNQLYETLIKTNKIEKAHQILEDFKNRYKDFPDFDLLPIVQELIIKDKREWIKFISSTNEEDKKLDEKAEEDEKILEDIQRFLKTR